LIKRCWATEASRHPTFKEILENLRFEIFPDVDVQAVEDFANSSESAPTPALSSAGSRRACGSSRTCAAD